jgi:acyl transferase domain-containing protein
MVVPTEPTSWSRQLTDRRIRNQPFGFGGTNAHVVVGGPILCDAARRPERPRRRRAAALRAVPSRATERCAIGGAIRAASGSAPTCPSKICASAGAGRSHFPIAWPWSASRSRTCGKAVGGLPNSPRLVFEGFAIARQKLAFVHGSRSQYVEWGGAA